ERAPPHRPRPPGRDAERVRQPRPVAAGRARRCGGGCEGLRALGLGAPPPPQAGNDVGGEALRPFDKSAWAQAARLLREAIVKQPMNLRLHYSLGVTAKHLELREAAI